MRIIAATLGICMAALLVMGTASALDLGAKANVNVDSDTDYNASAKANADSSSDVSVFAKIAAFFRGDDTNQTEYHNYSEQPPRNESESTGFWANVKAFLRIG